MICTRAQRTVCLEVNGSYNGIRPYKEWENGGSASLYIFSPLL